jgi:hypothetical protein
MIDYLFMRKNHGLSRAFRHEFKGDLELALAKIRIRTGHSVLVRRLHDFRILQTQVFTNQTKTQFLMFFFRSVASIKATRHEKSRRRKWVVGVLKLGDIPEPAFLEPVGVLTASFPYCISACSSDGDNSLYGNGPRGSFETLNRSE